MQKKLSPSMYNIHFLQSFMLFGCRVQDIQFCLDDLPTYVHLLNVALNTKLCLGKINDALGLGTY